MPRFVQLTAEDCTYLLNLINDMDGANEHTIRQRSYTVPKLEQIQTEPRSARLAGKDIDYLIELCEDDSLPELEQQRSMTLAVLDEIRALQTAARDAAAAKDNWRAERRYRRLGTSVSEQCEEGSIHTTASE